MEKLSKNAVIKAAEEYYKKNGRLNKKEICRLAGSSPKRFDREYPGFWVEIKRLFGMSLYDGGVRHTDDTLMGAIYELTVRLGRFPICREITEMTPYSYDSMARRFGCKSGLEKRYAEWLAEKGEEWGSLKPGREAEKPAAPDEAEEKSARPRRKKTSGSRKFYGRPINFRNLRNEPVNEQGVVFLFGMLSDELGFSVESLRNGFPDCEAMRRAHGRTGLWEKVMIEFEYTSSNFKSHRHNPAGCDLIVCWIHDWRECPVETLELRSLLDECRKAA